MDAVYPFGADAVHDLVAQHAHEVRRNLIFGSEHVDELVAPCGVLHQQQPGLGPVDVEYLEAVRRMREMPERIGSLIHRETQRHEACKGGGCVVDIVSCADVHGHFDLLAVDAHRQPATLLHFLRDPDHGYIGFMMLSTT